MSLFDAQVLLFREGISCGLQKIVQELGFLIPGLLKKEWCAHRKRGCQRAATLMVAVGSAVRLARLGFGCFLLLLRLLFGLEECTLQGRLNIILCL